MSGNICLRWSLTFLYLAFLVGMFIVSIVGIDDAACGEDRHCTIQENSKTLVVFLLLLSWCHLRQYTLFVLWRLKKLWQKADSTQRQNAITVSADDVADISCFQSQDCIESHFTFSVYIGQRCRGFFSFYSLLCVGIVYVQKAYIGQKMIRTVLSFLHIIAITKRGLVLDSVGALASNLLQRYHLTVRSKAGILDRPPVRFWLERISI